MLNRRTPSKVPVLRSSLAKLGHDGYRAAVRDLIGQGYRYDTASDCWVPPRRSPGRTVLLTRLERVALLLLLVFGLLIVVSVVFSAAAGAAPTPDARPEWKQARVSTYGWPGDGPYQPLAGCGYRKIGGLDAGKRLPCNLTPRLPIVANNELPLGTLVRVCYQGRCSGARVGDRCGPGCTWNGVEYDLSWGLAKRIGFPWTVTYVRVAVLT